MTFRIIYGILAVIALLLAVGYNRLIEKKDRWFMLLFISVFIVELGYLLVSCTQTLVGALMANRISYFGSVFLPLSITMVITNLCEIRRPKWLTYGLIFISIAVFIIAASPGITNWYYKDVHLEYIHGAATLVKEYGPLHKLYYVYLVGYMIAMAVIVMFSIFKKKKFKQEKAALLVCISVGNTLIWAVEQMLGGTNFEFLSVSYIITEVFLLFLYMIIQKQEQIQEQLIEEIKAPAPLSIVDEAFDWGKFIEEHEELAVLTRREKEILKPLLEDIPRKEIADNMSVTEHTIKKHTSNIFTKLEVANRKELREKLGIR